MIFSAPVCRYIDLLKRFDMILVKKQLLNVKFKNDVLIMDIV